MASFGFYVERDANAWGYSVWKDIHGNEVKVTYYSHKPDPEYYSDDRINRIDLGELDSFIQAFAINPRKRLLSQPRHTHYTTRRERF